MKFNKTYSHKRQDGVAFYGLPRGYSRVMYHHPGVRISNVRAWIRDTLINQTEGYHAVVNGTTNWQIAEGANVVYAAAHGSDQWNTNSIHVCVIPENVNYAHLRRLHKELERIAGKKLDAVGHGDVMPTQCPGDIDVNRIINAEEEEMKVTTRIANVYYRLYLGRNHTDWSKKYAIGRRTPNELQDHLQTSRTFAEYLEKAKQGKVDAKNHLPIEMRRVYVDPNEKKITQLENTLDKEIDTKNKLADRLHAKVGEVEDLQDEVITLKSRPDSRELNKLGEILEILIKKVGLK